MGSFQRRLLTHVFLSAGADDAAFQRSAGGLVGRWNDLASPSSGMTQPGIACLLCHTRSARAFATAALKSECATSIISLKNGHVQSTYWFSLGADRVTQGLNCKGQVPYPSKNPPNDVQRRTSQLHVRANSPTLNTTFCWRTTHRNAGPRPHSGSRKADKRPHKTSQ